MPRRDRGSSPSKESLCTEKRAPAHTHTHTSTVNTTKQSQHSESSLQSSSSSPLLTTRLLFFFFCSLSLALNLCQRRLLRLNQAQETRRSTCSLSVFTPAQKVSHFSFFLPTSFSPLSVHLLVR